MKPWAYVLIIQTVLSFINGCISCYHRCWRCECEETTKCIEKYTIRHKYHNLSKYLTLIRLFVIFILQIILISNQHFYTIRIDTKYCENGLPLLLLFFLSLGANGIEFYTPYCGPYDENNITYPYFICF